MRALAQVAVLAIAAIAAGCGTLSYDGMPAKSEPHAVAVERRGIDFVSVDGRPVKRPMLPILSRDKLRLTPGPHEIVTRLDWEDSDSSSAGDVSVSVTIRYWSRYRKIVALDALEGNRYEIRAKADLPRTDVSASGTSSKSDNNDDGQVSVTIDHELVNADDWRPIVHIRPIEDYWKGRALPVATIEGQAPAPAPTEDQAE
jgi:hypothetical protein